MIWWYLAALPVLLTGLFLSLVLLARQIEAAEEREKDGQE